MAAVHSRLMTSDTDLDDRLEQTKAGILALLTETGREGIQDLVYWLEHETDYFSAPASSRVDFHGCHPGGLAEHSANVYTVFEQKVRQYGLDIAPDEVIIASLLHDVCKVNQYKPNILKTGKDKGTVSKAKPYVVEDALPIGHGEKSLYLATQHIALTKNEAILIRWHMGPFDDSWENAEGKTNRVGNQCPAIYAFHNSDQEASKYLDAKTALVRASDDTACIDQVAGR